MGAVLTGLCTATYFGGTGFPGEDEVVGTADDIATSAQIWVQCQAVLITIVWSAIATWIAIKIADALAGGIRSDENSEEQGLDLSDHGEAGYSS